METYITTTANAHTAVSYTVLNSLPITLGMPTAHMTSATASRTAMATGVEVCDILTKRK